MKIFAHPRAHSKIEIVEISNGLTGREALQLEEFLYTCLDDGNRYILINLENIKRIDGLAFHVLEYFLKRGIQIRIFNVETEIQTMLDLSGKHNIIKSYNETDTDKAVSLFEKEILKKKDKASSGITGRRYTRINTSLQTEFKSHTSHNDEITYRAVIENLSEGGVLINKINAFNKKTKESANVLEMVGKEFCYINFSLNIGSWLIETNGECVWEASVNAERYAGVRFKDTKQNHNEMIKDYVQKQKCL